MASFLPELVVRLAIVTLLPFQGQKEVLQGAVVALLLPQVVVRLARSTLLRIEEVRDGTLVALLLPQFVGALTGVALLARFALHVLHEVRLAAGLTRVEPALVESLAGSAIFTLQGGEEVVFTAAHRVLLQPELVGRLAILSLYRVKEVLHTAVVALLLPQFVGALARLAILSLYRV